MERTEMRMLSWILGILLMKRLENEEIRRSWKITEKIKMRQRWYEHVQ